MKNDVAVFSVVYPGVEPFLDDFFLSMSRQSMGAFDIVICNDGLSGLEKWYGPYDKLNVFEIHAAGTPAKVRELGLNHILSETEYEFVIFADSDDCFSRERVETVLGFHEDHDIVVNDLALFDESGVYDHGYLSRRIEPLSEIKKEMVVNCNFMGLSNTSIRRGCLKRSELPAELVAVDWYLFASMLCDGMSGIFIDAATTFYRQHSRNTAGLGGCTLAALQREIRVKYYHYLEMAKVYPCYRRLSETYSRLLSAWQRGDDVHENYLAEVRAAAIIDPLWWENAVVLEEMF